MKRKSNHKMIPVACVLSRPSFSSWALKPQPLCRQLGKRLQCEALHGPRCAYTPLRSAAGEASRLEGEEGRNRDVIVISGDGIFLLH